MRIYKILYIVLFYNLYFFCCQNITNENNINNQNNEIQNAVYVIRNRKGDKNLDFYSDDIVFKNDIKRRLKKYILIEKENPNQNRTNDNITYYYILDNDSKNKIGINSDNKIKKLYFVRYEDSALWKIIPHISTENILTYYIQNKRNGTFWQYVDSFNGIILSETTDINNLTENNEFIFNKLYRRSHKIDTQLLRDEPIDVLIKYIDLSDPNLVRENIPQIKKDNDNGELRYSVRSILQNIPWIRKIFILMPNEKVSFFKPVEEIKEKIVYVKDKDLLGFDSACSNVFQFNLHKMKKFGLSENFILMDDDYFIAKPLNKHDFFYEDNGKIYPSLITSDYYEMDKQALKKNIIIYSSKRNSKNPHSTEGFLIEQTKTLLFMYTIFGDDNKRNGRKLIEPSFSHNAIPVKLSDIEEMYNYILNYFPFANDTLKSLTRKENSLQMQTFYMAYVRNQYDRRVSPIPSAFYDLNNYRTINKNTKPLFVINTGSRNYKSYVFDLEIKTLKKLFPNKVKYELDEENYNKNTEHDNQELNNLMNTNQNVNDFIEQYKRKKIDEINVQFNENFLYLNQKINELYKITNHIKINDNNSKREINYTNIILEEINLFDNEQKELRAINYKLVFIIIFFLLCKIIYYLKY